MRALLLIFALACGFVRAPARGAEVSASEYELKAAFIFNFTQFAEWPTNTFASSESPIVIGIVGPDPFGDIMDKLVNGEEVRGRKLRIERYARPADVKACHLLFVSRTLINQWSDILRVVRQRPILTVSDMDRFVNRGGIIQLMTERNLVRLRINSDAAREADITISSKLLRLADGPQRGGGAQ